jgi:hypothetical protein
LIEIAVHPGLSPLPLGSSRTALMKLPIDQPRNANKVFDGTIEKILVTIRQIVENKLPLLQFVAPHPEKALSGHVKRQTHMGRLS